MHIAAKHVACCTPCAGYCRYQGVAETRRTHRYGQPHPRRSNGRKRRCQRQQEDMKGRGGVVYRSKAHMHRSAARKQNRKITASCHPLRVGSARHSAGQSRHGDSGDACSAGRNRTSSNSCCSALGLRTACIAARSSRTTSSCDRPRSDRPLACGARRNGQCEKSGEQIADSQTKQPKTGGLPWTTHPQQVDGHPPMLFAQVRPSSQRRIGAYPAREELPQSSIPTDPSCPH